MHRVITIGCRVTPNDRLLQLSTAFCLIQSKFTHSRQPTMARSKQAKKRKQRERQGPPKPRPERQDRGQREYFLTPKENAAFEKYYKAQGLVPEEEWTEFMDCLRSPLPSTFRVTGFRSQSNELLRIIKGNYLDNLLDVNIEGRTIKPPKCLPWYPEGLAWQLDLERKFIRHSEVLKKLHSFLVQETESGNISRQEAVSMIPPLLLDVKPHHKVLDMCAAPGSKTAQILEMLHADEGDVVPEGFVVANDVDNKRCYLMVHQVKRLESPNFIVINQDASHMPNLLLSMRGQPKEVLKFDRILVDVPCSGDGTLRKNVDAWQKWNPAVAHSLSGLQSRILKRGVEMLAVGGRIVYSTCSFNPIEDEAVICAMLNQAKGALKMVDVHNQLPGLRTVPGRTHWKVMTKQGDWYERHDDVPLALRTQIRPQIFPPSEEEAEALGLAKCVRVLPHHQDTGGFFIAVMEKTAEMPWIGSKPPGSTKTEDAPEEIVFKVPEAPARSADKDAGTIDAEKPEPLNHEPQVKEEDAQKNSGGQTQADADATEASEVTLETVNPTPEGANGNTADGDDASSEAGKRKGSWATDSDPPAKKARGQGRREDPFVFLEDDAAIFDPIRSFYGITSDFPTNQLLVRNEEGKKRKMYFVSSIIKRIIQCNEKFRIVNCGLRVFARSQSQYVDCDYRLVQEGILVLFPHMRKRVVRILKEDIVTMLSQENPFLSKMNKQTAEALDKLSQGGCVYVYRPDDDPDNHPRCRLVLCGWKGRTSCRSFLPLNERAHFLRLCGHELKSKDDIMKEKEEKKRLEEGSDAGSDAAVAAAAAAGDSADASTAENDGEEEEEEKEEEKLSASSSAATKNISDVPEIVFDEKSETPELIELENEKDSSERDEKGMEVD